MQNLSWWLIAPTFLIVSLLLVGCAMLKPIGEISLVELNDERGKPTTEIRQAARVEVTAYVTGWVKAPANILIDQSNPRTPPKLREPQWVPSLAFAVKHPRRGVAILDTGLRAGACDYGLRPVYWVPCRNEPGIDLVSQLKAEGIRPDEIRYIVPSHFHGDHISGLSRLLDYADTTVLATKASMSDVRSSMRFIKGIPTSMVSSDMRVQLIDDGLKTNELGIAMFDVFGDGSLKLFRTAGHTNGHLSAIVRSTERDILFTFDASHLKANRELSIPSGAVSSPDAATASLKTIQSVAASLDNTLVIFGHEPSQWACVKRSTRIDLSFEDCDG